MKRKKLSRDEYLIRHHEFHLRGAQLAKKLTEQMVKEIRINREGMTDKQRAEKLGISPVTVYKIRKRERWGHI